MGQAPRFRNYTVNDGLANSMVYYAMQDTKGFIWFCTEAGVNRFDGRNFELFTIKDGLADNENFRCMEDSRGRIWFASYNGKLCYYNGSDFINERLEPGMRYGAEPRRLIRELMEDADGNIWFTKSLLPQIYRYDGKQITGHKGRNDFFREKMLVRAGGKASYLEYTGDTLFQCDLKKGTGKRLQGAAAARSGDLGNPCWQKGPGNSLYFITYYGLYCLRNDSALTLLNLQALGLKPEDSFISFTFSGSDLWLACGRKGLFLVNDFKNKGFTGAYKQFLDHLTVSSVICDNEGGVWATTLSEGVFYLSPTGAGVTHLPGLSVTALCPDPGGTMLAVGTFYGDFWIDSAGKIIRRFRFKEQARTRIKSLAWLSASKVFIGNDYTPYVYDLSTNQKKNLVRGRDIEVGYSDMDTSGGGLWLAARCELLRLKDTLQQTIYGPDGQVPEKLIAVAAGNAGCCWFTSIQNLYWQQQGNITAVAGHKLFRSNLQDLCYVNGELWLATNGNGIFIFKNNRLKRHLHSGTCAIAGNMCKKLVFDGNNRVWVATNRGLSVFDATTYGEVLRLTSGDVLVDNEVRDLCLYNNKVYMAGPSGVSVLDMRQYRTVSAPPTVYIRGISSNNHNYGAGNTEFDYHDGLVRLSYFAIAFEARPSLRYRYRLQNHAWQETGQEEVEFYDLKPGSYTFFLSAKKYNSQWSAPIVLCFVIQPRWYQSQAFYAVVLFASFFLMFGTGWLLMRSARRKNEVRRRMLESELRAIRLHMNPHFIFNTLSSLQLFIYKNKSPEAITYIGKFAQLVRWIMSYSDKQEITLEEELEFLKTYVALEQLRFEKELQLDLMIDRALNISNTSIPPLVIQPFIENAIKYGLAGREGAVKLKLEFEKRNGMVFVAVEDDGVGRDQVMQEQARSHKRKESTGIKYTEERLRLLMGRTHGHMPVRIIDLFDRSGNANGTRVELAIPIVL